MFRAVVIGCVVSLAAQIVIAEEKSDKDPALQRAQRELKMLDGIYKSSIVLVTKNYVNKDSDVPAGTAFKQLFAIAKKEGWHEVRLLDATGDPYNDENVAAKGFETRAIKAINGGQAQYDEVETADGKRFLRAATIIPVVMDKCVMCHDNYAGVPKGKAIGALSYKIPIVE